MDMIKNKLFWFGVTLLLGGIEMMFHLINHEKGTKLNFGEGQDYIATIFIVVGIISLGVYFYRKRRV